MSNELQAIALNGEIQALHDACQRSGNECLEYAVQAGERLAKQRELLPHGTFGAHVEQFYTFSERTARRYLCIHKRLAALPKRQRMAVLKEADSVNGLLNSLPKPEKPSNASEPTCDCSPETSDETPEDRPECVEGEVIASSADDPLRFPDGSESDEDDEGDCEPIEPVKRDTGDTEGLCVYNGEWLTYFAAFEALWNDAPAVSRGAIRVYLMDNAE